MFDKPSRGGVRKSLLDSITANANDILSGKVVINSDGELLTGTMANRGAWNSSVGINGSVTIPAGYHNGSGRVTNSTATMGGQSITPRSTSQTVSCSGKYMTGNIVVNGDSNLVAANIVSGKSIFGVAGNARKYGFSQTNPKPTTGGTFIRYADAYYEDRLPYVTNTSFGFTPLVMSATTAVDMSGGPTSDPACTGYYGYYVVDRKTDYYPNQGTARFTYNNIVAPVRRMSLSYWLYIGGYY